MANEKQLSRYGSISRSLDLAPSAKVFLVGDSDDTSYGIQNLAAEFPPDGDGVVRVYSTIQAAVNAASAGRGDVVLVAPGSVLQIGGADTWATADVSVIGMGKGAQRPILDFDSAGSVIHVGASGTRISNFILRADVTAVANGIDFDSGFEGHVLDNCKFDFNATGDNFGRMVDVHSANTVIEDNEFIAEDTTGTGQAISIQGGEPDNLVIRNNHFYGNFDTLGDDSTDCAGVVMVTLNHDSADTVLENLRLEGNTFLNTDTATSIMVTFRSGACTVKGMAVNNMFGSYDTSATGVDSAAVLFTPAAAGAEAHGVLSLENYYVSSDTGTSQRKISYNSIIDS